MLEVFGIGCLVVVLFFFAKEFGKKLPLGCLIVGVIFLFIVIKACNEMKEEEEEEKKKQQFQEEMKKRNEEQTREWQEMHGIYKENVYE